MFGLLAEINILLLIWTNRNSMWEQNGQSSVTSSLQQPFPGGIVSGSRSHTIPSGLRHVSHIISLATFKTKLKTYLFRRSQWLSKTPGAVAAFTRFRCHDISDTYLLTYLLGNVFSQRLQMFEWMSRFTFLTFSNPFYNVFTSVIVISERSSFVNHWPCVDGMLLRRISSSRRE